MATVALPGTGSIARALGADTPAQILTPAPKVITPQPRQLIENSAENQRSAAKVAAKIFESMYSGVWGVGAEFHDALEAILSTPHDLRPRVIWCYEDHYQSSVDASLQDQFSKSRATILSKFLRGDDTDAAVALFAKATAGLFLDRKSIFMLLDELSADKLNQIEDRFQSRYGSSLVDRLSERLTGWELEVARAVLSGDKLGALVGRCHGAIHRLIPDSENLITVVSKLSAEEREKLATLYKQRFGTNILHDASYYLMPAFSKALSAALSGDILESQKIRLKAYLSSLMPAGEKIANLFLGKEASERNALVHNYRAESKGELLFDLARVLDKPQFDLVYAAVTRGKLSTAEKLRYHFSSGKAQFDTVSQILSAHTRKEMSVIRAEFKELTGSTLENALRENFGGRKLVTLRLQIFGKPQDVQDEMRRFRVEREMETSGLGAVITSLVSWKGKALKQAVKRVQTVAKMCENSDLAVSQSESAEIGRMLQYSKEDLDGYRRAKDGVVNRIASIGASAIAASAVGLVTFIPNLPITLMVGSVAAIGAIGYTAIKKVLRGPLYDHTNLPRDLAIGAVDGGIAAVVVGSGQLINATAGKAGKTSAQEILRQGMKGTVGDGLVNAAGNGVSSSLHGAAFGVLMNLCKKTTWEGGIALGIKKLGVSFVTDSASGSVGRAGALLARYRPKSPLA